MGCAPMKEVHEFGVTSHDGLDRVGDAAYGYYDYCFDSCLVFAGPGIYLRDFDCDCHHGRDFDTVLKKECRALGAYFAALAKLADPSAAISCAPIGGSIQGGTYGSFTVTATEASIATTIATGASYLLTTGYKDKKIREIIGRYHDSVGMALSLVMLHVDNLRSKIQLLEIGLKQRCDTLMIQAQAPRDKWMVAYAYKQKIMQWDQVLAVFDARYKTLEQVRTGNETIFKRIDQLKSEGFKKTIMDITGNISYLSASANK